MQEEEGHLAEEEFELGKVLARLDQRLCDIEHRLDALAPGVAKMDRHVDFVEGFMAWGLGWFGPVARVEQDGTRGRLAA